MAAESTNPVRCLIVPSDPGFLVIPSAAVAEIVPLSIDREEVGSATGHKLGTMSWRGEQVPVYSMEELVGLTTPSFNKRSKAFIFYPWKGAAKNKFFAIAILHDPRPRLLSNDDIEAGDKENDLSDNDFIRSSFQFDGEAALIPDLQAISEQVD